MSLFWDVVHWPVEAGVRAGERPPSEALMMTQFGVGRASLRERFGCEFPGIVTIKSGQRATVKG